MSAVGTRQGSAALGSIGRLMQGLMQPPDFDYGPSALLLVAHGPRTCVDVERRGKIALGPSCLADSTGLTRSDKCESPTKGAR
jgi:hypothetical protein